MCECAPLTFSRAWFLLKDFVGLPYLTDNVDGEGTSYITFFFFFFFFFFYSGDVF